MWSTVAGLWLRSGVVVECSMATDVTCNVVYSVRMMSVCFDVVVCTDLKAACGQS